MKISICIPTYHGTGLIKDALESIIKQDYSDFEIIVCNDSMDDHSRMESVLRAYKDGRITYYKNKKNLGYPLNMRKSVSKAKGDVIFLMAQDDIVIKSTHFSEIIKIFKENPQVGCMTRPYYWFEDDIKKPIRYVNKPSKTFYSVDDDPEYIHELLETVGQLSGLVMKKELITHQVNEHVFPAHIYPFLSVMRTHQCYFFNDFTIAVKTESSQTRFLSSIYHPSPVLTWVSMFNDVFPEDRYKNFREIGIRHITTNYVGLVQIKNYGYYRDLFDEIYYMIRFNPKNLISYKFWFYLIGVLAVPRFLLRKMVDYYKNVINKRKLGNLLE